MKKRIITAICIALVIVPAIYFDGIFFLIVGLLLSGIAGYEMMRMFYKKSPTLKYLRFIVPVLCMLIVLLIHLSVTRGLSKELFAPFINEDGTLDFSVGVISFDVARTGLLYHFWTVIVCIVSVIISVCFVIFTKGSRSSDITACITTLAYCGLIMGFAINVEYIQPISNSSVLPAVQFGGRSFAYVFVIVCVTDIVAYFFGRKFGKRKLCPYISPNKTVGGAVAGLIAGAIVGTVVAFLFQLIFFVNEGIFWKNLLILAGTFALSCVISFAGVIGDLIASRFKRDYGIKDFGRIFPGHGGVLDRFDSLILAAAVYYVFLQFAQLVLIGIIL